VQREVLSRAARAGGAAFVAPAPLIRLLLHQNAEVRSLAVQCLGKLGAKAAVALPLIRRLTNDPDAQVQRQARKAARLIEAGLGQ
jgi:HEAT repeat protein